MTNVDRIGGSARECKLRSGILQGKKAMHLIVSTNTLQNAINLREKAPIRLCERSEAISFLLDAY